MRYQRHRWRRRRHALEHEPLGAVARDDFDRIEVALRIERDVVRAPQVARRGTEIGFLLFRLLGKKLLFMAMPAPEKIILQRVEKEAKKEMISKRKP